MEQLPKIAQQRLRVTARPGPHPDANLLAALAEKSLAEIERQQVLAHLAQCADCRGLVLLALPELPAAAGSTPGRAGFPWLSWSVLRWATAAACVVMVGAAVTLRYAGHKSAATFSTAKQQAPAAEYKIAPQPPPAVVGGDKLALKVEPKIELQDRRDQATRVHRTAPVPSPLSNRLAATTASGMGAASSQVAGEVAPSNNPSPGTMMQQVVVTGAAPAVDTAKADAEMRKKTRPDADEVNSPVPSVNESVEVQAEAPVINTQDAELAPGKAKDVKRELSKGAPGSLAGGKVTGGPVTAGPLSGRQYYNLDQMAPVQLRWSLSVDGALLRSLDAGKSWQAVPVAEHMVFRAVSATGPDVWAGGIGGVLYHSTDGGQHWLQVKASVEGRALTDDIISIEFGDANHGKITTAKSVVWVTNDAGQSWQKQ